MQPESDTGPGFLASRVTPTRITNVYATSMPLFLLLLTLAAQAGLYVDATCKDTVRAWRGFDLRNPVETPRVEPGSRPSHPSLEVGRHHAYAGGHHFLAGSSLAHRELLVVSEDLGFVAKHEIPNIQWLWASAGKAVAIVPEPPAVRVFLLDGVTGQVERELLIDASLRTVWEPTPGELVLVVSEESRLPAGPPQVIEDGLSSDLLGCDRILYTRNKNSEGMTVFVPIPLDGSALHGSGVVHHDPHLALFGDTVMFHHDREMHELRWLDGAVHWVRSLPIPREVQPAALVGEYVYANHEAGFAMWGSEGLVQELPAASPERLLIRGRHGLEITSKPPRELGRRGLMNIRQVDLVEMSPVAEYTIPTPRVIRDRAIYTDADGLYWFDLSNPDTVKHLAGDADVTGGSDGTRALYRNRDGTHHYLYRYDRDDFCQLEREVHSEVLLLQSGGLLAQDRSYPRTVSRFDDDCNLLVSRDGHEVIYPPPVERRSALLGHSREIRDPFWLGGLVTLLVMGAGILVFGRRARPTPDAPEPVPAHHLPGLLHGDQWLRFNVRPMRRRLTALQPLLWPLVAAALWVATSIHSDPLLVASLMMGCTLAASISIYRFRRAGSLGRAAVVFAPIAHLAGALVAGLDPYTGFDMLFHLAAVLWSSLFAIALGRAVYALLFTLDIEADQAGVRWWRNILWTRIGAVTEVATQRVDLSFDGARWVLDLDGRLLSVDHPDAGTLRWLSDEARTCSPATEARVEPSGRRPPWAFVEALPLIGGVGFAVFVWIVEPHSRHVMTWIGCCLAVSAFAVMASVSPTRRRDDAGHTSLSRSSKPLDP